MEGKGGRKRGKTGGRKKKGTLNHARGPTSKLRRANHVEPGKTVENRKWEKKETCGQKK